MKKIAVVLALLIFGFSFSLNSSSVLAQDNSNSPKLQKIVLENNEVVNKDYFAAGDEVLASGTVNGDAYIAGANVIVDGQINGDLLVAGGNVNVRGNVSGDVRIIGGQVTISGKIKGNVSAVYGNLLITDNAVLGGSVAAAGGNLEVYAPITKGLTLAGGSVTLGNLIGGDINAWIGNISLLGSAKVTGDINYWSSEQGDFAQTASISGQISRHDIPKTNQDKNQVNDNKRSIGIYGIITSAIVGSVILKFAPNFSQKIVNNLKIKPGKNFLWGIAYLMLIPFFVLILFISILAIPLSMIIGALFVITLYISKIFGALYLGSMVFKTLNKDNQTYQALFVGLLIIGLLGLIPFVGAIVGFIVFAIGLGGLLNTKRELFRELTTKKII